MVTSQGVLPGLGKSGRVINGGKGGRHRQQIGALGTELRKAGRRDQHTETLLTMARALADSLDRMEHDPDASEHTLAMVMGRLLDVIRELVPTLQAPAGNGAGDPLQRLADAAAAAVRDSAPA